MSLASIFRPISRRQNKFGKRYRQKKADPQYAVCGNIITNIPEVWHNDVCLILWSEPVLFSVCRGSSLNDGAPEEPAALIGGLDEACQYLKAGMLLLEGAASKTS
jgi:hypothetical protein